MAAGLAWTQNKGPASPFRFKHATAGHEAIVTLTAGATYATGGIACDLTTFDGGAFPTGRTFLVTVIPSQVDLLGYTFVFDATNKKVKVYSAADTELANSSAKFANAVLYLNVQVI